MVPRLAEIRRRFNGPTIPMPQEDVAYLLKVAERATALLDALRQADNWAVAGVTVAHFFRPDDIDWPERHPDAKALHSALVSLQNALEGG